MTLQNSTRQYKPLLMRMIVEEKRRKDDTMARKKIEFAWRDAPSTFHKADAQKCGEEMGDSPTPESVLAKAKDPTSELHKCFEWDDTKAAEKYRLTQARQIIQFIIIKETKKKEHQVRYFQISKEQQVYKPITFFLKNEDEYTVLLDRAKRELKGITERYSQLNELEEVFEAIARL